MNISTPAYLLIHLSPVRTALDKMYQINIQTKPASSMDIRLGLFPSSDTLTMTLRYCILHHCLPALYCIYISILYDLTLEISKTNPKWKYFERVQLRHV